MLVYIAQEGVKTTDLFRRPGNSSDTKVIIKKLADGKQVTLESYNFYTLASVIKVSAETKINARNNDSAPNVMISKARTDSLVDLVFCKQTSVTEPTHQRAHEGSMALLT